MNVSDTTYVQIYPNALLPLSAEMAAEVPPINNDVSNVLLSGFATISTTGMIDLDTIITSIKESEVN